MSYWIRYAEKGGRLLAALLFLILFCGCSGTTTDRADYSSWATGTTGARSLEVEVTGINARAILARMDASIVTLRARAYNAQSTLVGETTAPRSTVQNTQILLLVGLPPGNLNIVVDGLNAVGGVVGTSTQVYTSQGGAKMIFDANLLNPPTTITNLKVTANPTSVNVGATSTLTATATVNGLANADVTASTTFTSVTPATATINNKSALGVNAGTTQIRASVTIGGVTATTQSLADEATLTVTAVVVPPTITNVKVTANPTSVTVGSFSTLTATATFNGVANTDVTASTTFTSVTPATATINNKSALGVAVGTTQIRASVTISGVTATTQNVADEATLTVTAVVVPPTITNVKVTANPTSITVGAGSALTATATFNGTANTDVTASTTFTSVTPATATINNKSAVGVASGTTQIRASVTIGGVTATTQGVADEATLTVNAIIARVSLVNSTGAEANGTSTRPSASGDGRYVAFTSAASNLVAGDTNASTDIFVRDRQTGATTRVSVDSNGNQANGPSFSPSISSDGRYVAFVSLAPNLVTGDNNSTYDVFVRDTVNQTTIRVSVATSGAEGDNLSGATAPSVSANGRYVAFDSLATNLIAGYTNVRYNIFVRDTQSNTTTLVSRNSSGVVSDQNCHSPSISANGQYVAFESQSENLTLVTVGTGTWWKIFVRDTVNGTTIHASTDTSGVIAPNSNSLQPSISADGLHVAFASGASNLVANDTNGVYDMFVHDLQPGLTTRVSVDSNGTQSNAGNGNGVGPSISGDGRYVGYYSPASNLVANDTNGVEDAFVHDRQTGITIRVSVSAAGVQGNLYSGDDPNGSTGPSISADGRYLLFTSQASNLVVNDTNGAPDIFVRSLF